MAMRTAIRATANACMEGIGLVDVVEPNPSIVYLQPIPAEAISNLRKEYESLKGFLGDARERQEHDPVVKKWMVDIRDLVDEVEEQDRITRHRRAQQGLQGCWNAITRRPHEARLDAMEMEWDESNLRDLTQKISLMTSKMKAYGIENKQSRSSLDQSTATEDPGTIEPPVITSSLATSAADEENEETVIIGRQEDVETIEDQLIHVAGMRVVGICGVNGLGKTTLANKVFNSKNVADHFDARSWAFVGPGFDAKDILNKILLDLLANVDEEENNIIGHLGEDFLSEIIRQILEEKRCLVVLDDFQNPETWNSLQTAFSSIQSADSSSKLLLTACDARVLSHVDRQGFLHQLRFLNREERWQLLRQTTRSNEKRILAFLGNIMMKLDVKGKPIIEHCLGLPLTISLLAGVYKSSSHLMCLHSDFYNEVIRAISKVVVPNGLACSYIVCSPCICCCNLCARRNQQDLRNVLSWGEDGNLSILELEIKAVLTLSDTALGPRLRACLLAMSRLPEGIEIPAEELFDVWIDNRIFRCRRRSAAKKCFKELVDRNLIEIVDKDSSGKINSCRLHSVVRDFYFNLHH